MKDATAIAQCRQCNVGTLSISIGFLAVLASIFVQRTLYHPKLPTFAPHNVSEMASGLVVVVTGANSGLGFDTVRHLVLGRTPKDDNNTMVGPSIVVMACRDKYKCDAARERIWKEVDNKNFTNVLHTKILTLTLDLADPESIQAFAKDLPFALSTANPQTAKDVTINVLINNAGVFTRDPSGVAYQQATDEHILVNHLGHVLLMHHLWSRLIRDKTRIVAISSIAALLPIKTISDWRETKLQEGPFLLSKIWNYACPLLFRRIANGMISYGRSKRANIVFAHELHRRYSHLGISSVASHPGIASTELWIKGAKIFPAAIAGFLQNNVFMSHSSHDAAATQVWAALDHQAVPSGYYVGPRWWFKGSPVLLGPLSRHYATVGNLGSSMHDRENLVSQPIPHHWPFSAQEASQLWDQSLRELGIEEFGEIA